MAIAEAEIWTARSNSRVAPEGNDFYKMVVRNGNGQFLGVTNQQIGDPFDSNHGLVEGWVAGPNSRVANNGQLFLKIVVRNARGQFIGVTNQQIGNPV